MDYDDTFSLILSGKVTIVAGGESDHVRIELTETQLRSLAYHTTQAVNALRADPFSSRCCGSENRTGDELKQN